MKKVLVTIISALFSVSALAATVDLAEDGTTASYSVHMTGKNFLLKNRVDFTDVARGSNDVLQVVNVPAGSLIFEVGVQVTTAEGEACTVDIGDASDPDRFVDGGDINAVAFLAGGLTSTPYLYTADDTIDVTLINGSTNNVDGAVIEVFVSGVKLD